MGLLSALNSAVSGLNVNQQNLNILSQNISNANTPNYSKEVVHQAANFIAGQGEGATVASVTRSVSDYLSAQVNAQSSVASGASVVTDYYAQIQNLLGQPGTTNSIDQGISSFFVAMQNLANSPSATTQTSAINAATSMANQLSTLANSLENLRMQADTDINGAINNVNADLKSLIQTNLALQHAAAVGQNTAGLLDQRDASLNDLSQYMDIKPSFAEDGEVSINTTNGVTLLTNTTSAELQYSPISSVTTLINNSSIGAINVVTTDANGNVLGQKVPIVSSGPSSAVTTSLTSGKILGLLHMRDSIIPNVLSQLDTLAGTLRDKVNAINNAGTSFPPPNSYTGTTLIKGSDISQYSGSVQIAVLGSNGSPVSSPYTDEPNGLQPLTLDLSALNTGKGNGTLSVDGLINTINQFYGPPQNKMELGNINNAQLDVVSDNIPDTGNTLNFAFNLNNISSGNADFYTSGYTVLDSSGSVIASSTAGTVTSTQPALTLNGTNTYQTTSGSNTVTVTTTGNNTFKNGDIVYLNAPSGSVNGLSGSQLGGYFTVSNVTGNTFDITVSGAGATSTGPASVSGVTGFSKYDSVNAGKATGTAGQGIVTAQLGAAASTSPYFTVQATIATVDSGGNLVQSVVSYRVPNNQANSRNELIGAASATQNGKIMAPTTTQPLLTATLVDADGKPLPKTNGLYGNQAGYLKIAAGNSSYTVAINELDSQQLATVTGTVVPGGSGQGLSQYFGLNNFFNPSSSKNGDTVTNSALNLSVESRITNNPSLISTGKLTLGTQPTNASSPPNYTYVLTSGDNTVSQQFAALSTSLTSFTTSGGLPASSTTFAQYAGQILAATSTNSANATTTKNNSQALLDGYTKSAQSVSGVNLDQELANTVIYQNAYSASARVISVVGTMFDALINSIQ
ncbi:MAG TPA: flagellar hook-associated protein FlgK [Rickettsiales bacterium]|nr:flagellar hook-associated protein FlgK [Rickettsiales bacterium]